MPRFPAGACLAGTGVSKTCPQDCLNPSNLVAPNLLKSEDEGGWLYPDECLVSANKAHKFCYQSDGNMVLYNRLNKSVWESDTAGLSLGFQKGEFSLSDDGQLSAYDAADNGTAYWAHGDGMSTAEDGPFDAILRNDGNLAIYRREDKEVLWSTSAESGECQVCHISSIASIHRSLLALQKRHWQGGEGM
jgi:hypothetical protein